MTDIIDDIGRLAKKFSDYRSSESDFRVIAQWKDTATRALLIENLLEHDGVRMLVAKIDEEIRQMDILLMSADSKTLPDLQRDRVLDRRDMYIWFRSFFRDAQKDLSLVRKEVGDNLKRNGL